MKTVAWTGNTSWDEVLRQGEREEVVLIRDGHAVAMLMPFDDDDLQWYARERDPAFLESIATARRQVKRGKTIGHLELKRELGIEGRSDPMTLEAILDLLERYHQRATYGAVAGVVGGVARSVMFGRPPTPRNSWVVSKKSGQPTGYESGQRDVNLEERDHVIEDVESLRNWLRSPQ